MRPRDPKNGIKCKTFLQIEDSAKYLLMPNYIYFESFCKVTFSVVVLVVCFIFNFLISSREKIKAELVLESCR
jgi:hypothetical protein